MLTSRLPQRARRAFAFMLAFILVAGVALPARMSGRGVRDSDHLQTLASNTVTNLPAASSQAQKAGAFKAYGKLPLQFESNQGQTDARVNFITRASGATVFLTATEAVFVLSAPDENAAVSAQRNPEKSIRPEVAPTPRKMHALRMKIEGSHNAPQVEGLDQLPGIVNYFIGDDADKWHTNIPTFGRVHYSGVYDGVDLVYYGNQMQLEYDFVVEPGADYNQIALNFEGADALAVDASGDLLIETSLGTLRQRRPLVYQEIRGEQCEVGSRYDIKSNGRVGFRVEAYDASRPLIIDPVLAYSTYLGGTLDDVAKGIAVDSSGNAYVTGETSSANFPTANPIDGTLANVDTFVTKVNASGSALVYSTFLGGSSDDRSQSIAVDSSGNAYVTGFTTSTDFPTASAIYGTIGGGSDAFVTKLNASGSALAYSTYLGGSSDDGVTLGGIAVNSSGEAYVTAVTTSTDFPTTAAIDTTLGGTRDAFVTKLNASGSALIYSTYLGGSDEEDGRGIAVDTAGSAYVTGFTQSTNFPRFNPIDSTLGGAADAFVTKFDSSGMFVYSTYLGGGTFDFGNAIAVDLAGNAYVTGTTDSFNFPTEGAIDDIRSGILDAFVTKLNASGSALTYSTFLGGSVNEEGHDIAVDAAGNAYVTGFTSSGDFPTAGAIDGTRGGTLDAFVTKFNASGSSFIYSTFLGGSADEIGYSIAADTAGNAYATGFTPSTDFPTTGAIQPTFSGPNDAFITKIGSYAIAGRVVDTSSNGISGVTITLSGSNAATTQTDAGGNFIFLGTTPNGEYNVTPLKAGVTFSPTGNLIFNLDSNRDLLFIGSSTTPTPTPTATPSPTPSPTPAVTFQFSAASFAANEGAGKFQLIVTRIGDTSQPQTVDYATSDGTANDRGDYTTAIGRLRFQPGDTAKSFDIFITDDVFVEGNETVQVTLSNPSAGSQLGGMMTALLTIVDNDLAASSVNPIDDTVFFVRQHYIDFLNREPDAAGLNFWANQITSCGSDAACIERRRINVSAAFFLSIEFQETGYLIHRLYRASFNRFPRYREFLRDAQEVGRGVVVGTGAWAAQLEANKQQFTNDFVVRADFLAIYAGLTNEQYVDALNVNTGNSLSVSERNALVAGLNGGMETRASTLRKVVEDADFAAREFTKAFVLAQYIGYLRRNPDDAPDTNFDGYNFWLNKLDSFGGDFQKAEMVKAFISSLEYRQRFGQP